MKKNFVVGIIAILCGAIFLLFVGRNFVSRERENEAELITSTESGSSNEPRYIYALKVETTFLNETEEPTCESKTVEEAVTEEYEEETTCEKENYEKPCQYHYTGDRQLYVYGDMILQQVVDAANAAGKMYDFDPYLLMAIMWCESGFVPTVTSCADCRGLMQLSYFYSPSMGTDGERLYEIRYNVFEGARWLREYFMPRMNNDVFDALRAYHWGEVSAQNNPELGADTASQKIEKYNYFLSGGTFTEAEYHQWKVNYYSK